MREELEKLVTAGKIQHKHIEPLMAIVQQGYCLHKGWGFGKVKTLDGILGRLTIDFIGRPGHGMDLAFAAEGLKAIGRDHVLARKATDLNGLKQEAARDHLAVVKLVILSFGGHASADQIQAVLVPDVIGSDWKKWWETARMEMKKDGHFHVPAKKSEQIIYQVEETTIQQRLLNEFRGARGLKIRVAVATEVAKSAADLSDRPSIATEVINTLNPEIQSHLSTMASLALEGIFARDDVRNALAAPAGTNEVTEAAIWGQEPRLHTFLEELPATKHRRALESMKAHIPDWAVQLVGILNSVPAKLCGECGKILMQEGKTQLLKDTIARLVSQHGASSELLLWFGKERCDTFADILTPEVFRAMLTAMERDAFNEKKSNRLHDFILSDVELLPELIESADIEIIRDLTRTLQLSPAFDDMEKRSLLARIVKAYPAIQRMITGDQKREDNSFLVSWESLERRKAEYDDMVNKKIPANSRDIALARSYGDLRENHEYKSAKEMQRVLSRRKHELESQLARARGTDFSNPRTDVVTPGTIVTVTDINIGQKINYTLLGAWDGDPEKNILSYLTPLAQTFVNKPVGAEVVFEGEGQPRRLRIEAIKAWRPTVAPAAE
jgi:transcription elongation GreA/GreB family factor